MVIMLFVGFFVVLFGSAWSGRILDLFVDREFKSQVCYLYNRFGGAKFTGVVDDELKAVSNELVTNPNKLSENERLKISIERFENSLASIESLKNIQIKDCHLFVDDFEKLIDMKNSDKIKHWSVYRSACGVKLMSMFLWASTVIGASNTSNKVNQ
ncbi:hypothetical protein PAUR_a2112 [Pseudoalteromonas aurantia 208]|uniref:Uncharacterized protein n=2 Tax=Pseudoalteromonas aurantia TaxID=43654 RepID=A0ABR9EBZ5_9GAMM|nr:hypothetical protein [Pseudoalteromonas aurantia 208]